MASLLLFLYIPKILKNLNKWWRGCSSLKYAILYVKRCARGGIVQEVVQASSATCRFTYRKHLHPPAQLRLKLDQGRATTAQGAVPPAQPLPQALHLLLSRAQSRF